MIQKVTIVGMGAIGILLGDLLTTGLGTENVLFLADEERVKRYAGADISCNGRPCDFRIASQPEGEAELLIFAVKYPDLTQAMALAAPCVGEHTIILSLLNGVTTEEILGSEFGRDKVLDSVTQGMDAVRDGTTLTYHNQGTFFVGLPEEDYFDRGEKLAAVMELADRLSLPFVQEPDILHRMWCKFMLNVGINQVCMAFETDYGGAQKPGEIRETMIAAMHEVRKVGACQGVLVTQKDVAHYLELLAGLEPTAIPSMRQDALAHRKSEVELFAGTVLQMANRYGMNAPVNQMLYDRICAMETNW